jgi:hypothetical protein
MVSWRGAVDSVGTGCFLMLLLLDDDRIVPGTSSETTRDQQMMEVKQRRHSYARRTDPRHADAGDGVQHPRGDGGDHARHHRDVNKPTGDALLSVMPPDAAPVERVPGVMDFNFLPDMRRMTG